MQEETLSEKKTEQLEPVFNWISITMTPNYQKRGCVLNPGLFLMEYGKIYEHVQNGLPKGTKKECFHNAALNVIYDNDCKTEYVEGIVSDPKFGQMYHGWNLVDGKPMDFTLTPGECDIYYGVVIPKHLVMKAMSNVQKTRQSDHGVLGTLALYKNNKRFLDELGIA